MAGRSREFCDVCGEPVLDDDQEYCDYCGSRLYEDEEEYDSYPGDDDYEEASSQMTGYRWQDYGKRKRNTSANDTNSGSCLGSLITAFFIILLIIVLVSRK